MKPPFLASRSFSKEMVIEMKTKHMVPAESMNITRRGNLVTYKARRVPCSSDQQLLARLILVFAKVEV